MIEKERESLHMQVSRGQGRADRILRGLPNEWGARCQAGSQAPEIIT